MSKKICTTKGCKKAFWTRKNDRQHCFKHDELHPIKHQVKRTPRYKKIKHQPKPVETTVNTGKKKKK